MPGIVLNGQMQNGHHRSISLTANQLPVIQAGHFLFTSESVGEGHPGNTWRNYPYVSHPLLY